MEDMADREMTVLVSSHNAKEMEDVCNYIGIIAHGRMVFEGDLLEIMPVSMEEIFIEKLTGSSMPLTPPDRAAQPKEVNSDEK